MVRLEPPQTYHIGILRSDFPRHLEGSVSCDVHANGFAVYGQGHQPRDSSVLMRLLWNFGFAHQLLGVIQAVGSEEEGEQSSPRKKILEMLSH